MDFIKTFVALTEYTIPYGTEDSISHLLPKGLQKDKKGNYFITIGENSKTLFTCHLDTVSRKRSKVKHNIHNVGDTTFISTDGTTILGGDNKAGVCILMYLIEQNVPGTYYFFVGEEVGAIGSNWALNNNRKFFSKFNRAVAFDRKKYGSIITHQKGSKSTSLIFANKLSEEFGKYGMEFKPDNYGIFTDTAVFMGVIPECTNISSGVFGEHTKDEYVDITYTEAVAKASAQIDWENLPTERTPKMFTSWNSNILHKGILSSHPAFATTTQKRIWIDSDKSTQYIKNKNKKVSVEEARDIAISKIKDMVYKQEVYKSFVNISALMFDPYFVKYNLKKEPNINEIIKWMENIQNLGKPAIYDKLKPYLKKEFWSIRLTEENIQNKIKSLDIKIKEETKPV